MGKQRRSWSVEEKLAIVLAVLSARRSVAEVARQRGVDENPIYRWKEQFLEAGRQRLSGAKARTARGAYPSSSPTWRFWREVLERMGYVP